jgi:hypothetical protein
LLLRAELTLIAINLSLPQTVTYATMVSYAR